MKPIVLSPSSLSVFQDCPRCFWLRVVKHITPPSGIFPSLPSGMDKVLKAYFDKLRHEGKHPEELKDFKGQLFPDLGKLEEWRNNRKGLRYFDDESGITLMGAVDDIFVNEKGQLVPLDFKTRGYPLKEDTHEHYQHQLDIYAYLLEKNGYKTANFAILLFYHPLCVNSHCNVEFHADTVKMQTNTGNAEKLFKEAVRTVKGDIPHKTEDCPFCDWNPSEH